MSFITSAFCVNDAFLRLRAEPLYIGSLSVETVAGNSHRGGRRRRCRSRRPASATSWPRPCAGRRARAVHRGELALEPPVVLDVAEVACAGYGHVPVSASPRLASSATTFAVGVELGEREVSEVVRLRGVVAAEAEVGGHVYIDERRPRHVVRMTKRARTWSKGTNGLQQTTA